MFRSSRLLFAAAGLALAALLPVGAGGCAGDSARVHVLGPAMAKAWPGVKARAENEIALHERAALPENADAAAKLGIEPYSTAAADMARDTVKEFDSSVTQFNQPVAERGK